MASEYRFGFNGQEQDKVIYGESYTADYWQYDSRIGQRWNLDLIYTGMESRYATFGNNPIFYNDPDGLYKSERRAERRREAAIRAGYGVSEVYKSGKEW